ncbi:hypothetical protein MKEN_00831200 [Mycena kentingensis (nom. inval.)]|nr:hypothetical protein MKEN_01296200 [Mycena kentingensis (nom. inval.)]KAF7320463.1 hypothetical protein MKEN_00831200 [Mycena kentingensis (nom. inval.)]
MRIHVAGLGYTASLIGHHLRRATPPSHSLVFLHSDEKAARNAPLGFHVQTKHSTTTSTGILHELYQDKGPIESLFVATRPFNSLKIIRDLAPRLSSNSTIVLLTHGLSVFQTLIERQYQDPERRPHFVFASLSHPGYFDPIAPPRQLSRRIIHSAVGNLDYAIEYDPRGRDFEAGFYDTNFTPDHRRPELSDIAGLSGDPELPRYRSLRNTIAVLQLTEALNPRWKKLEDVQVSLRRRVVFDSIIQPLGAVFGCSPKALFATPQALRMAHMVCNEASAVFAAQLRENAKAWVAGQPAEDVGNLLGMGRLSVELEPDRLFEDCVNMAKDDESMPNMLMALRHGRLTDIDYLNTYLLKLGRQFGVNMMMTAFLRDLVRMRVGISLDHAW